MNSQRLANFFRSRYFLGILIGLIVLLIVFAIFEAGVAFGYHEAMFSARWGEDYGRNFGEPEDALGLPSSHMPMPEGNVGQIASITGSATSTILFVSSKEHPEEKVLVDDDTIIRKKDTVLQPSQLAVGMSIVVLGAPNSDGAIDAKFIRVFSTPPGMAASTSTSP